MHLRHPGGAVCVMACALLVAQEPTLAITSFWNTNSDGNFTDPFNWSNGTPNNPADTAAFQRGTAVSYTVTFPGSPVPGTTANYMSDRMMVGSNTVTFAESTDPGLGPAAYRLLNTNTTEAGRGIVIGHGPSDTAVLNSQLSSLRGAVATIGHAPGSHGTLNVDAGVFSLTGNDPVNYELAVGLSGTGVMNISNGADVTVAHMNGQTDIVLGRYANSSGTVTVSGAGSTLTHTGMVIGDSGAGGLTIQDTGKVSTETFPGLYDVVLGASTGATGTVNVNGATWDNSGGIYVGGKASLSPNAGTGVLNISASGLVTSGFGVIGSATGGNGTVNIDGFPSRWTLNGGLFVGGNVDGSPGSGNGELNLTNGGNAYPDFGVIGAGMGASGTVNVNGAFSLLGTGGLYVGGNVNLSTHGGTGDLNVTAGGAVRSGPSVVGSGIGGTGTVFVDGAGSEWIIGVLHIGGSDAAADPGAVGTLQITGGGIVSSSQTYLGRRAGSTGNASVSGADSSWFIDTLHIGGDSGKTSGSGGTGTLDINPGAFVQVWNVTTLHPGGTLRLQGGTLGSRGMEVLGDPGSFEWTSGTFHVHIFVGSLINQNGTLAPIFGVNYPDNTIGPTTVFGDYTQQNGGTLDIEIGGTWPGVTFDHVNVFGTATLDGELNLSLTDGFTPSLGDTFQIISATNVAGTFASVVGTDLGNGMVFDVLYSPTDVVLKVVSALLIGDLNADGFVGIADLNIVLGNWNQNVTPGVLLEGDPSGDGFVGIADLNVVLGNWNAGTPPGATSTNIPEPATVGVGVMLLLGMLGRRGTAC